MLVRFYISCLQLTPTHMKPEEIRSSTRYQSMMAFMDITGIGSTTAQKLYDLGLRTLQDLAVYADVDDLEDGQLGVIAPTGGLSHGAKRLTWPEALKIREDLETKSDPTSCPKRCRADVPYKGSRAMKSKRSPRESWKN